MKYLGVDFGLRRIGLATSEGNLASPLKIVETRNLDDAVSKMIQVIEAEEINQVIVGMPEGKTGQLVKKFIKTLQGKGIDIVSADETLSSQNATSLMVEMGKPQKKRASNDAFAAALILQQFLDSK